MKIRIKLFVVMIMTTILLAGTPGFEAGAEQFNINYREAVESGDYIKYLSDTLSGVSANALTDSDLEDIANYIEYVIRIKGSVFIDGSSGITVDPGIIEYGINMCCETKNTLENLLSERNIILNRTISSDLMVFCEKVSLNDGISLNVPSESLALVPENTNLRIILKRMDVSIAIRSDSLKTFAAGSATFGAYVKRDANEDKYLIEFKNPRQETMERIIAPVRVSLPAENAGLSVYAAYGKVVDNWGGQYNAVDRTLDFDTVYSGEYDIREAAVNITDISHLDEEQKIAIGFMTARNYFTAENGEFKPDLPLSRYDYTEALVRMFFAIDNNAETSFSDVPRSSEFYRFVASSQNSDIVEGFEDGTFRGDTFATVEQVSVLAARTIADKLGYNYPSDPNRYMNFVGAETVSNWARAEIALAYRERIFRGGDVSRPISRAEAATSLYRLFNTLYNTPDEALPNIGGEKTDESFWTKNNAAIVTAVAGIIDIASIITVIVFLKKRRTVVDKK